MSNPSDKSSGSKTLLPVRTIVLAGIAWAVLALLFFLLFSSGEDRPQWYLIGTYVFELVAYLSAAILCFRNWQSPQIVSGRQVWLAIGAGMLSYFIGGVFFGLWELVWGLEPDVSLGDLFYILTYIFLGWGMTLAVTSRRLNLEKWQWGIVGGIAAIGIILAYWIASPAKPAQAAYRSDFVTQTVLAQAAPNPAAKPAPKVPSAQQAPKPNPAKPVAPPAAKPKPATPEPTSSAPGWVLAIDDKLKPIEGPVSLFYIVSDVVLLILATMLLLAFWGGRFSQSWRMIAAAAVSLYIADMWLKWAENNVENYESGSLPEVFWVFSGVLFAIGAALEYDTSSRSRRTGGRRRA